MAIGKTTTRTPAKSRVPIDLYGEVFGQRGIVRSGLYARVSSHENRRSSDEF
jgi:hypothetical protein